MSKRGNGEGSIYRRADTGSWTAAITAQTPNGRRRRWITGASRAEVAAKLATLTVARGRGTLVVDRPTVAQFLGRWLGTERRLRTQEVYAGYCRREIIPALGDVRLDELSVAHVAGMLKAMYDRGLSAQTVQHARAVLRSALSQAMREELVYRNVASIAKPPAPIEPFEGRFLTPEDAKRFLAAANQDRLSALYRVALALGLRTGEALALQWSDIDFEARTIHVRHTLQRVRRRDRRVQGDGEGLMLQPTKTRQSKQKLPMPEICVRALRAHRARQLEERFAAGSQWAGTDFVFTTPSGKRLHAADVMDESFRPTCVRAGIPYATRENLKGPVEGRGLRFYDLRHSCASLLIAQGVPLKVIQEILRHSNIRTTSDRYTHLVPQVVGDALAAMDRTLLEDAK